MVKSDYEYRASLDLSGIATAVNQIDSKLNILAKQGDKSFKTIGGAAQQSGALVAQLRQNFGSIGSILQQIGGDSSLGNLGTLIRVASGDVTVLVEKFVQLAQQAIATFQQITDQAIQMNQEAQTATKLFANLFGGDEQKGAALANEIIEIARTYGIAQDAALSFGQSLAPDAENVGQLKELTILTDRFADLENKKFGELRFTINEAVTGQFESAKDILNLSSQQVKRIKELQVEYGNVDGLIRGLTEYLEERGLGTSSVEAMAGTAQQAQKGIEGIKSELLAAYGAAPFEEWNEQLNAFGEFLNENREPLLDMAYALGDVVAAVMDLVNGFSQDFMGDLDMEAVAEQVRTFADSVIEVSLQLQLLTDTASNFASSFAPLLAPFQAIEESTGVSLTNLNGSYLAAQGLASALGAARGESDPLAQGAQNLADTLNSPLGPLALFGKLKEALTTLNQVLALSAAGWAGVFAGLQPIFDSFSYTLQAAKALIEGDTEAFIKFGRAANEATKNGIFDEEKAKAAAQASLTESLKSFEEIDKKRQEVEDRQKKRGDKPTVSDEEELPGAKKAGQVDEKTQKALEKVREAEEEAEIRHQRALADIEKDEARKRLDLEQDFADKRLEIAENNQKEIEEIYRDHEQDIQDAAKDLSRKEQDIATKHAQDKKKLDQETAQKKVDIEKDYQKKIRDIRKQFEIDAEEAERSRDAVAFLAAVRRTEQAVDQAKTEKEDTLKEAKEQEQLKKEELKQSQQQEIEEAHLANQRKLEDLQINLQRELEAQEMKYQEDLLKQAEAEAKKTEEMNLQFERRREDAEENHRQNLEDMERRLGEEYELVKKYEEKKQAEYEKTAASKSGSKADDGDSDTPSTKKPSPKSKKPGQKQPGVKQPGAKTPGSKPSHSPLPDQVGAIPGFAGGGLFPSKPFMVGEKGPEIVDPIARSIIPTHQLMYSPPMPQQAINRVSNSRSATVNVDPGSLSPQQRIQAREEALALLEEME